MKKFQCPRCGGCNITQTTTNGVRTSAVLRVDPLNSNNFLSCSPEFNFQTPKSCTYYECTDCGKFLEEDVAKIINDFFVEKKVGLTCLPESKTRRPDVSTLPKYSNYKINPLKHCRDDSVSVRETIDMINFIITSNGSTVKVSKDNSTRTRILNKVIKERPYLFERHY